MKNRRALWKWLLALTLVAAVFAPVIANAAARVNAVKPSISNHYPYQYKYVTAKAKVLDSAGRPIQGAKVVFTWNYKSTTPKVTAYTNSYGNAYSKRYIGGATAGYKVVVKETAYSGGVSKTAYTWFTPKKNPIVYVTRTGSKYHRGTCSYLRYSKISIRLSEAKAQGFTACSVCF